MVTGGSILSLFCYLAIIVLHFRSKFISDLLYAIISTHEFVFVAVTCSMMHSHVLLTRLKVHMKIMFIRHLCKKVSSLIGLPHLKKKIEEGLSLQNWFAPL